jgi:hemolysin III
MSEQRDVMIDSVVQGAGLLASLVGVVVMVGKAAQSGQDAAVGASLVYGLTLVAMFLFSLMNTLVQDPKRQAVIRLLDHSFIYCLIAGTYTPFCLLVIGGRQGLQLLLIMWLAAALGVVLRVALHRRYQHALITLYVLMGWSGMIHADLIATRMTTAGLVLLLAGGLLYTIGAPLHRFSRLRYHSAIWHGCVLAASACHYAMMILILNEFSGGQLG